MLSAVASQSDDSTRLKPTAPQQMGELLHYLISGG